MDNCLTRERDSLIKRKELLVQELSKTSFWRRKKINELKKLLIEIDFNIASLERAIEGERQRLIRMGINPDAPFEHQSEEEIKKEYDSLRKMGADLVDKYGEDTVKYVLDNKIDILTLITFDMLYNSHSESTNESNGHTRGLRK